LSSMPTTGASNGSACEMMEVRVLSSTSPETNSRATTNAISWSERSPAASRKPRGSVGMRSGMYKPLSGARPCSTASRRLTRRLLLFVLSNFTRLQNVFFLPYTFDGRAFGVDPGYVHFALDMKTFELVADHFANLFGRRCRYAQRKDGRP